MFGGPRCSGDEKMRWLFKTPCYCLFVQGCFALHMYSVLWSKEVSPEGSQKDRFDLKLFEMLFTDQTATCVLSRGPHGASRCLGNVGLRFGKSPNEGCWASGDGNELDRPVDVKRC